MRFGKRFDVRLAVDRTGEKFNGWKMDQVENLTGRNWNSVKIYRMKNGTAGK